MQFFKDSVSGTVYSMDDHVTQQTINGVVSFVGINGNILTGLPAATLVSYIPPAPTAATLLSNAIAAQSIVLNAACNATIIGGFTSSALGAPYLYPFNTIDQINLSGNISSSFYPSLPTTWVTPQMCATIATTTAPAVWAYVNHTVAQIQQVGLDAKTFKINTLTKHASLQAQLQNATSPSAAALIVW